MSFIRSKHINILLILLYSLLLNNCQIQKVSKNHGINFLKNRGDVLVLNDASKNDVIKVLGKPHATSISDDDKWFYFERVYTRGKLHKLGQNVLVENNVLDLTFNKYGILVKMDFLDKKKMKKVKYSKLETLNTVTQTSFVNKFLQSVKQKMYSSRKKN